VTIVILAAGLMVLVGVGLFVAAVLTGVDALYWACVAVCVAAAVLLFLARRRLSALTPADAAAADGTASTAGSSSATAPRDPATPAGASEAMAPDGREAAEKLPDPGVEDVEVTDLLLVVDLEDEVLVLDEHPRYHLAGCVHLRGRTPIPLPQDEARTDGFTPCAVCEPDHTLAEQVRARKAARGG
jgi:hypothetical protein